ncbi:MAG: glycoside hydrolase family 6 protein [bacterium]|nr:glycoside hydrolase family 6 protein [bacterium]
MPSSIEGNKRGITRRDFLVKGGAAVALTLLESARLTELSALESPSNPSIEQASLQQEINPFADETLFLNPYSQVANAVRALEAAGETAKAEELRAIADQPAATWFGDWNITIEQDVNELVSAAQEAEALPVMVLYNITNRDVGLYSAGGSETNEEYLRWIDGVADGVAGRKAVVIFEPDALGHLSTLDSDNDRTARVGLMKEAIDRLVQAGIHVYVDASQWVDSTVMAVRLMTVGVGEVGGPQVAINTSGLETLEDNLAYYHALRREIPSLRTVIDTSRNGNAVDKTNPEFWCNPPDAAIGLNPTTQPEEEGVDALLWIKAAGESDGICSTGEYPPAGVFDENLALNLIRNRN